MQRRLLLAIFFGVVVAGCLAGQGEGPNSTDAAARKYTIAPTALPGVSPEMQTPGFWIGRLTQPDEVILSEDEIQALNRDIQTRLRLTKDIAAFPGRFDGNDLATALRHGLHNFRKRILYGADGREVGPSFYAAVEDNMQLGAIDSAVEVRFALVVDNADQRLLPTGEGVYAAVGDIDFDEVQNNALDIGTPVAILHASVDGRWLYTMGPSSDGWIAPENVALCSHEQLREIMSRPFVTVVRAKGNIYRDAALTRYHGFVRMGATLFLAGPAAGEVVAVTLPTRRADGTLEVTAGYLKRQETVTGHLACTPRHIIEQAFEMLYTPYGWGGMYGQQDCSQFVQEVFATVGLALPRNSSDQAKAGRTVRRFTDSDTDEQRQTAVVTQALPGLSLLYMRGHVMLYLGTAAGRPYVIHDAWAYREPGPQRDDLRVINRVAVTELRLGEGSRIGSLLSRLTSIQVMTPPAEP